MLREESSDCSTILQTIEQNSQAVEICIVSFIQSISEGGFTLFISILMVQDPLPFFLAIFICTLALLIAIGIVRNPISFFFTIDPLPAII